MTTTKQVGKSTRRAADVWAEWHQKEPEDVTEMQYPLERYRVFRAGYADAIVYHSDKWEDSFFEYLHQFDSGPDVFTVDGDGAEATIKALLRVGRVATDAEMSLPILAVTEELIVTHDDGSKTSLRFDPMPMLTCSLDKKALLILSKDGPIIVRGGKMFVDERGIHR